MRTQRLLERDESWAACQFTPKRTQAIGIQQAVKLETAKDGKEAIMFTPAESEFGDEEYHPKNAAACYTIFSLCSDTVVMKIQDIRSAKEMWDTFQRLYVRVPDTPEAVEYHL